MKNNIKYLALGGVIFLMIMAIIMVIYYQMCFIKPIDNAEDFLDICSEKETTCYDLRDDCSLGRISYFSCVGDSSTEEIISNLKALYNRHRKIVLIDSNGEESYQLALALKEAGFKNISYYETGYESFLESYQELYDQSYEEATGDCDC